MSDKPLILLISLFFSNLSSDSRYLESVTLKLPNKTQESAHMKLVETEQDIPQNISIPIKGRSGDKFFTIQTINKKGVLFYI